MIKCFLKQYPDYYEVIKKPIDLREVAKRILAGNHYTSIGELEADLLLMMDNAKRYNDPKSLIYKDALKMKAVIRDTAKELSSLSRAGKPFASSKSREKKLKLVEEIAGLESSDETLKRIGNQPAAAAAVTPAPAPPPVPARVDESHDDDEEENSDEEEEEEEDSDDEANKSGNFILLSNVLKLFF